MGLLLIREAFVKLAVFIITLHIIIPQQKYSLVIFTILFKKKKKKSRLFTFLDHIFRFALYTHQYVSFEC